MSRFHGSISAVLVLACTWAIATCGVATFAVADDGTNEDCLKQGDAIGAFYVTKVAGAEDDGVEPGDDLCYRCRYGSSPMVMVFTRQIGGKVPQLVKELDAAVTAHEESRLKGLLTLMGEDAAVLKEDAKKVAQTTGTKNVPVVIAKETKTGPLNYRLPSDAEVTIIVAQDSQVVATHTFAATKIDVAAIMKEVKQMLN
jgi:hypothetical protein